jgi:ABC-2 type transport system ATP-binding protein
MTRVTRPGHSFRLSIDDQREGAGVTPAIELQGLRKEYRRRKGTTVAVAGLDLSVPEGGVYGFLGPNGSGKTTTIRCLLGLARPTAGRAALLGAEVPGGLAAAIRRVGAVVETPALFPTMSGRENLRLLARIDGLDPRRVDHVLDEVGLTERAGDLVRKYSLGMRQRLGLAAALLKDPALLVLDEPANGLDPAGIRQVRELIRRLGREGRTVFVSSHILAEVEQTCDAVAILHRGRCVAEGTVADVMASAGAAGVRVTVDDLTAARQVLERAGLGEVETGDGHLRVAVPPAGAGVISRVLAAESLWVTDLRPDERTLEDLFLELTSDEDNPQPSNGDAPAARQEVAV